MPTTYFWLDAIFDELRGQADFHASWSRVASIDCNAVGSAHSLALKARGLKPLEARRACLIRGALPYVIKLDKRVVDPAAKRARAACELQNAHYAVLRALGTLHCAAIATHGAAAGAPLDEGAAAATSSNSSPPQHWHEDALSVIHRITARCRDRNASFLERASACVSDGMRRR